MTASRRRLLALAGCAFCGVTIAQLGFVDLSTPDFARFARPRRVDLRSAGIVELTCLPGIGRARAVEIVLHRVRHGPIRRLEDLLGVDGIGPRTLERIAPFVTPGPGGRADEVDTAPAGAETSAHDDARFRPDPGDRPARPRGGSGRGR